MGNNLRYKVYWYSSMVTSSLKKLPFESAAEVMTIRMAFYTLKIITTTIIIVIIIIIITIMYSIPEGG